MFTCNFRPYEGNKPYIFISYSHKDSEVVYPIIERLNQDGYRVWFDDGITPGSEWPEYIAERIDKCFVFIFFTSPNSVCSENCRREVNFVASRNKRFFSITLEPTKLSLGMEMQISTQQNIAYYEYPEKERFFDTVYGTPFLYECKREPGESETIPADTPAPLTESTPEVKNETVSGLTYAVNPASAPQIVPKPAPAAKSRKAFLITGISVAAVVLAAVICLLVLKPWQSSEPEEPIEIVLKSEKKIDIDEEYLVLIGVDIYPEDIDTLNKLTSVSNVDLSECSLKNGADLNKLTWWDKVETLEIEDMNAGDYGFFEKLQSLESLSVSEVDDFPVEKMTLIPSAKVSRISFNKMSLPESVGGLEQVLNSEGYASLTITDCTGMKKYTLQKPVETLCISGCGLSELVFSEDVSDWERMETIDLSDNQLQDVVFLSNVYESLKDLSLAGNPIENLSLTFILECKELQKLDLSKIPLNDLSVIQKMKGLYSLRLSDCGLETLENDLENIELSEIDLSHNKLSSLKGIESILCESVGVVDVSHNQLTSFEGLEDNSYFTLYVYANPLDYTNSSVIDFLNKTSIDSLYTNYGSNLEKITFTDDFSELRIVGGDKKVIVLFPESIDVETVEEDEVSTLLW